MGGATFAIGEGATGLFTNPAAAAVRPTKPSDRIEWNAFFNSYVPASGVDFNNNGDPTNQYRSAAVYAPGLIFQVGAWGVALNAGYSRYEVAPQAGGGLGVRSIVPHLSVARHFEAPALTVGVGVRGALLNVYTREGSNGLFTNAGASAELGTVWQPPSANLRFALAGALPVYTGTIQSGCDPLDCFGYILPSGAAAPWILVLGSGYRIGRSPWNQKIETAFRDERAVTLGLDLIIIGALSNTYSIEEFAAKRLQPSGRHHRNRGPPVRVPLGRHRAARVDPAGRRRRAPLPERGRVDRLLELTRPSHRRRAAGLRPHGQTWRPFLVERDHERDHLAGQAGAVIAVGRGAHLGEELALLLLARVVLDHLFEHGDLGGEAGNGRTDTQQIGDDALDGQVHPLALDGLSQPDRGADLQHADDGRHSARRRPTPVYGPHRDPLFCGWTRGPLC